MYEIPPAECTNTFRLAVRINSGWLYESFWRKHFYYVYDNLNIIAILDKNKELLASIVHDEAIDKPLSITVHNNTHKKEESYKNLSLDEQYLLDKKNQQTFYYHRDHLGSIIALSNDKKEIIEEFIYDDSYGKILKHEKLVETYNPYCYTGREFDNHELYYYRARYYDPTLQIFLSKDPIGFLSGDYNFYRYVENDPLNFVDPSGLNAICKGAEIIGGRIGTGVGYIVGGAATGVCAAITGGGCLIAGPLITSGTTIAGGWGGKVAAGVACEKIISIVKAETEIATEVKVKADEPTSIKDVKCGDYGKFKDQKNPANNNLERDHIPSQAAVLKRAADDLGRAVDDLGSCIKNRLKNWAETLALPTSFHKEGRTNGAKNTPEQVELDADNLGDAVDKDIKEYEKKLDDADIPEECKGKIRKALEEIKKKTDKSLNDFIDKQIQHCIDAGKFKL